ncbi:MAG: Flagellar P-ring protein [Synergistales bacterium 53_16]|nr:MAG: Flagellar P-ring protein [Synergistales bacterium 53_16]
MKKQVRQNESVKNTRRKGAMAKAVLLCVGLFIASSATASWAQVHPLTRLKDIGRFEGVRPNQLVGMGLVMGLQGTGDRGDLVEAMLGNLVENFGISMSRNDLRSRNAAVVTVTCELPPFVRSGEQIDVTVSAMGDAKSLEGGVLLQTPLRAANGEVYAVAQGPVSVGGFSVQAAGSSVSKNVTNTARIPNGAIVERETSWEGGNRGTIRFLLRRPDFTTASRVAARINDMYGSVAVVADAGCVEMRVPAEYGGNTSRFIAAVETLEVRPDALARVVVNERTGTVTMGGNVRISEVAVAHGNLTVTVQAEPGVSQPEPFSLGETVVLERATIEAEEQGGYFTTLGTAASVQDVVESLNALGATPRDIITILQAIDQAGALQGELVVM